LSFWHLFVFQSYNDKICLNDLQGLFPKHIINQQFYFRQILAALTRAASKMGASVVARTEGGGATQAL
jgi:hypothetical protein